MSNALFRSQNSNRLHLTSNPQVFSRWQNLTMVFFFIIDSLTFSSVRYDYLLFFAGTLVQESSLKIFTSILTASKTFLIKVFVLFLGNDCSYLIKWLSINYVQTKRGGSMIKRNWTGRWSGKFGEKLQYTEKERVGERERLHWKLMCQDFYRLVIIYYLW